MENKEYIENFLLKFCNHFNQSNVCSLVYTSVYSLSLEDLFNFLNPDNLTVQTLLTNVWQPTFINSNSFFNRMSSILRK